MEHGIQQARKARGWSQARLIYEIEKYARERSVGIASSASLKVYVSEWENGRRAVSAEYAAILRGVLGATDEELFGGARQPAGPTAGGYDDLLERIATARTVSASMVATLTSQTELLRTMDRQLGSASLVDQVHAHLGTMQETLAFAVMPDARRPVARALAEAASMAAWQALDVGAADRAWRHYELAKSAAREAESTLYYCHSMGEQAFVLADAGQNELAVELVQEAIRLGGGMVSPRLRAWLYAAEAELCANAGQVDNARRALDRAAENLPNGKDVRDPELPSVFLNGNHLARWRGHTLALLGDDGAVSELYAAIAAIDSTFIRAQAGLRCDLAQAHLIRGELGEATEQLREARLLANRTGSVRFRRRIERLTAMA